jgi:hypothetical protein
LILLIVFLVHLKCCSNSHFNSSIRSTRT